MTSEVPRASRAAVGLAAALAAVLLGGCRPGEAPPEEPPACPVEPLPALAPPVYSFAGEPLNLSRDERLAVDRWVEYFRDARPDRFSLFLRRAGRYEDAIRAALRADGLPEDFLYLALIESGMDPAAVSRAEAVGLWQFLHATGAMFGLEISALVDERRSPDASTRAAISYLSDLHEQFGDWFLAAAAYNGGPGRVSRAIRRAGTRDYWRLALHGHLPRETAEYVPKLIAAAWLGREPGLHGFAPLPRETPPAYDSVRLYGRGRLGVVAAAAGVREEEVRALNPALVGEATPAGRWMEVRLPPGAAPRFREVWPLLPPHHRSGTLAHRVRPGETLGSIARFYGVTTPELLAANPDVQPRRLRPGHEISVPAAAAAPPLAAGEEEG